MSTRDYSDSDNDNNNKKKTVLSIKKKNNNDMSDDDEDNNNKKRKDKTKNKNISDDDEDNNNNKKNNNNKIKTKNTSDDDEDNNKKNKNKNKNTSDDDDNNKKNNNKTKNKNDDDKQNKNKKNNDNMSDDEDNNKKNKKKDNNNNKKKSYDSDSDNNKKKLSNNNNNNNKKRKNESDSDSDDNNNKKSSPKKSNKIVINKKDHNDDDNDDFDNTDSDDSDNSDDDDDDDNDSDDDDNNNNNKNKKKKDKKKKKEKKNKKENVDKEYILYLKSEEGSREFEKTKYILDSILKIDNHHLPEVRQQLLENTLSVIIKSMKFIYSRKETKRTKVKKSKTAPALNAYDISFPDTRDCLNVKIGSVVIAPILSKFDFECKIISLGVPPPKSIQGSSVLEKLENLSNLSLVNVGYIRPIAEYKGVTKEQTKDNEWKDIKTEKVWSLKDDYIDKINADPSQCFHFSMVPSHHTHINKETNEKKEWHQLYAINTQVATVLFNQTDINVIVKSKSTNIVNDGDEAKEYNLLNDFQNKMKKFSEFMYLGILGNRTNATVTRYAKIDDDDDDDNNLIKLSPENNSDIDNFIPDNLIVAHTLTESIVHCGMENEIKRRRKIMNTGFITICKTLFSDGTKGIDRVNKAIKKTFGEEIYNEHVDKYKSFIKNTMIII